MGPSTRFIWGGLTDRPDCSNIDASLTCPSNLCHLNLEFSRKLSERTEAMKKSRYTEEQIIGI